MNLVFNNAWMSLHAYSMRKLHKIEHIALDHIEHNKAFNKGFIGVAGVPENESVQLMAKMSGGDSALRLKSFNCDASPYLDLYVRCDGKYFQVSGVFNSIDACNVHSKNREDVGLMCTFDVVNSTDELHFMTSLTENKTRTKAITVGA